MLLRLILAVSGKATLFKCPLSKDLVALLLQESLETRKCKYTSYKISRFLIQFRHWKIPVQFRPILVIIWLESKIWKSLHYGFRVLILWPFTQGWSNLCLFWHILANLQAWLDLMGTKVWSFLEKCHGMWQYSMGEGLPRLLHLILSAPILNYMMC